MMGLIFPKMKKIKNRSEFVTANILEAGLMRPVDAANFMGISRSSFSMTHMPKMETYQYEGIKYVSFLEVFERSLKNDLKFNKSAVEEVRKKRKIQHVRRLDAIKHIIK